MGPTASRVGRVQTATLLITPVVASDVQLRGSGPTASELRPKLLHLRYKQDMRSVWSQARSHRVARLLPLPPLQTKALARTRPVAGCRCATAYTMDAVLPAGRWASAHPSRRRSSYAWPGSPNSSSCCPRASLQNTCAV